MGELALHSLPQDVSVAGMLYTWYQHVDNTEGQIEGFIKCIGQHNMIVSMTSMIYNM